MTANTFVVVDEQEWADRARALGGSSGTLRLGLSVRLGEVLGRVDRQGQVALSVPVSDRTEGDTRANAIVPLTLRVDPSGVTRDLRDLRETFSTAVAGVRSQGSAETGVLPLVPFVPPALARRLERSATFSGSTVYFSHLGPLDPALLRPMGTDAIAMILGGNEAVTLEYLDRIGGAALAVLLWNIGGQVGITVRAWQSGVVETSEQLRMTIRGVLDEFGLTAEVR